VRFSLLNKKVNPPLLRQTPKLLGSFLNMILGNVQKIFINLSKYFSKEGRCSDWRSKLPFMGEI